MKLIFITSNNCFKNNYSKFVLKYVLMQYN